MKQLVVATVYAAAIVLLGCQALAPGARAAGTAAMTFGYYGMAAHAFKIAVARNPQDCKTLAQLAQAEVLNGDDVDAFGSGYSKLVIRSDA
jgi:hypothetical protein